MEAAPQERRLRPPRPARRPRFDRPAASGAPVQASRGWARWPDPEVGTDNAAESAIHSKAAAANLMSRNYKAAAAEADRALALNPRNAHARLMRATARNGMKNYRGPWRTPRRV